MPKTDVQKSIQAEDGHGKRKIEGRISSRYSEEMHDMEIISHETSRKEKCRSMEHAGDVH